MRVIVVVGARPNFVKIAPLMPALEQAGVTADIVHTGQHYDAAMSDIFFRDLAIPEPRWWLGIGAGTHAVQTGAAMVALEELLEAEHPDALIVVGDVNSTLAGALAAAKIHVPVVHLEAGLRSGDMSMPEEVNRLVTDQLSAMLLAPTRDAVHHLTGEGCDGSRVRFVGNIMAESCLTSLTRARSHEPWCSHGLEAGGYVLATIHRPENADDPKNLAEIVSALSASPLPVLMPVHPRTRSRLDGAAGSLRLCDPVGYLDMVGLESSAAAVVTDSGGVQEEACLLHVPCVTVRRNTERVVTIELGANRLCSARRDAIASALDEAMSSSREWGTPELWDDRVSTRVAAEVSEGVVPLSGC